MLRALTAGFALLLLLVPQRLIDFWEPVAFTDRGDAELRSWILPVARLEGLGFLALATRAVGSGTALTSTVGLIGVPAALAPRRFIDWGLPTVYTDADDIEVKSWVVPFTRLLGIVYVLIGLRGLSKIRSDAEESDAWEA